SHVGDSWADPTPCLRINIEGTANVLDASAKVGAQRVLLIGSSEEYGKVTDPTTPVKEDEPLRPLSPYGASKVAASYLGVQAFYARDLPVVRVRAFGHTGPGQSPKFVVPALAHRIAAAEKSGANEIVMGSLTPVRDLSDVRDIVRAYRLLLTTGEPGEVYNVGRGVGSTIGDIAKSLIAQSTATLEIVTDPALVRPVEMPGLIADTSKIRAATGWEPEHSLDDTLASMLEAARNA
ncbi:MAG TPA: GDP-mannose 4,6-dehydratase, partial [Acidimicrobiia bacterium]|nr:GDP-mannose 4,6-dehydratase [Acidimicrobiia bacterium]